jgi:hypothetical protein
MGAEGSSETSVSIYQTTWHHIPEHFTLTAVSTQSSSFLHPFTSVDISSGWLNQRAPALPSKAVVFNLFVRVPLDIISLQLCTPKAVGP